MNPAMDETSTICPMNFTLISIRNPASPAGTNLCKPGAGQRIVSLSLALVLSASCSFGDGPELVSEEAGDVTPESVESDTEASQINADQSMTDQSNADQVNADQSAADSDSNSNSSDEGNNVVENVPPVANPDTGQDDGGPDTEQPNSDTNRIVRIPRTDTLNAPKIDGQTLDYLPGTQLLAGEWRFAAQFDSDGQTLGVNQFMFGEPDSDRQPVHHWAAMHDGVYLYLLVISDDAGIHFQDTNESRKPWKDDSIELFIDGNHSLLNEYDGVDDFHMTVNLLSSPDVLNSSFVDNPLITQSDASAILPSDLLFSTGPQQGPLSDDTSRGRKDFYEFRIKLSELNIVVDAPFGIEIQINDDDNGGTRDAKWGWNHPPGNDPANDLTWQNPSTMGTAVLLQ